MCGIVGQEPDDISQLLSWLDEHNTVKAVLPSYILTMLGDRMEMAHSIEGRVPFLDHRVVECIRSQPVSMKIRSMTESTSSVRPCAITQKRKISESATFKALQGDQYHEQIVHDDE